jgi:hypothetical protein
LYLYAPKNQQAPVMVKTNVTMVYEYPITGATPLTSARRSVYLIPGNITISIDATKPLPMGGYLPLVLQNDTFVSAGSSWVQPIIWSWNVTASENVTVYVAKAGWYTLCLIGTVYYNELKSSSGGAYKSAGWGASFSKGEVRVEASVWVSEKALAYFRTRTYPWPP